MHCRAHVTGLSGQSRLPLIVADVWSLPVVLIHVPEQTTLRGIVIFPSDETVSTVAKASNESRFTPGC